ncbi:PREDICTED: uncharacterized protein LOC106748488 [Dinoponera quadriceps]|uniref:Uncharacterized protein LOC106748488 n=1 Tax=Dinoponera quadriceps TaxID=609295 RepID=A0A6P3XVH1_DINQU|nr:PREDICTED: uncharacterized protein LOC106748488 [Dinoponera quadriceps]
MDDRAAQCKEIGQTENSSRERERVFIIVPFRKSVIIIPSDSRVNPRRSTDVSVKCTVSMAGVSPQLRRWIGHVILAKKTVRKAVHIVQRVCHSRRDFLVNRKMNVSLPLLR